MAEASGLWAGYGKWQSALSSSAAEALGGVSSETPFASRFSTVRSPACASNASAERAPGC